MLISIIIIGGVILRLLPHVPNFAPITATALFGGVYLRKRYAIILPIATMAVSDYLLLYFHPFGSQFITFNHFYPPAALFASANLFVWVSFAISGLVGMWLKNHKNVKTVLAATLFCSIQFFLVTNAAVWLGGMYSRGIMGLWESYIAGIPFFRYTIAGDFFYTGVFFGSYELAVNLSKKYLVAPAK